ncbi:hypothetical protein [Rhizobium azibense]|uniref:Uncharacterized protein n=1 Tax=Rhizobium azibense TaxID=1136135 RepID=A0A4R3RCF9_9HYPH|nr:hypothetical protein [Rhizobium azibense]TCU33133.1 hypothetical protein EV129_117130 [Rhizobium azibense]
MTEKKSRAFIIGDKDHGLTIVITDPVMVVHYSMEDLANPAINQMAGKEPIVAMSAVVQELLPFLRGVNLDLLEQRERELQQQGTHRKFDLDYERKLFEELHNAAAVGRVIRNNGTVCDVDFCVALDIEPGEIVSKPRSAGPAVDIRDYLKAHEGVNTVPAKIEPFVISNLRSDNLSTLDPWEEKA